MVWEEWGVRGVDFLEEFVYMGFRVFYFSLRYGCEVEKWSLVFSFDLLVDKNFIILKKGFFLYYI